MQAISGALRRSGRPGGVNRPVIKVAEGARSKRNGRAAILVVEKEKAFFQYLKIRFVAHDTDAGVIEEIFLGFPYISAA
jgi:hypothetical protein